MRVLSSGNERSDRGATLVEAAFTLPLFFLLVLGLIDFGLVGFNDTQAGNASRDGARVAAIGFREADVPGRPDWQAVRAAIEQNLPDRVVGSDVTLTVECVDVQTNTRPKCDDPAIQVDVDRINVVVTWDQPFISPIAQALGFKTASVSGNSTVVIVGAPVAGPSPIAQPCSLSGVAVAPDPVERYTSGVDTGELHEDLEVVVSATGVCASLEVRVTSAGGGSAVVCSGGCTGTHQFARDAGSFWEAGIATATVTDGGGESGPVSAPFEVADDAPLPCVVSATSVAPASVARFTNGSKAGELKSNLTIRITGSGVCDQLVVQMTAPNGSSVPICNGSCLGLFVYDQDADNFWTKGTATLAVTGPGVSASTTFEVTN